MALSITVRLRQARYDAAATTPVDAEWPPHPARLFNALVAAVEHGSGSPAEVADLAALRWLEQAGPPLVAAVPPTDVHTSVRSGFVVTNATEANAGSTFWPGRTNRSSSRSSALPADDRVAFVWPAAEPDDGVLWRLTRLARRVPYLGRSTGNVEITVHDEHVPHRPKCTTYQPTRIGTPGSIELRVPYPGYADQLVAAYDNGQRAWETARSIAYAVGSPPEPDEPPAPADATGPYRTLLVWPVRRGHVPIRGDRILQVAGLLRRTVMDRVADPLPAQVSGHGADGRPHLAYLPLLDVGHRHADGHLLGVAVALPTDLPDTDRRAVLAGLFGPTGDDPIQTLNGNQFGPVQLADPAEPPTTWGVRADRWTGPPSGAKQWVTASPMMLDHFPNRSRSAADIVADGLVTADYPRPASVTVLDAPVLRGAISAPRRGTLPKQRPSRPLVHCRISFAEPVRGPVIAGALRYLGCGVFVPEVPVAQR
ncbi:MULTISPECIES: type I-U CRISPR-associated protein Csb2 [unclassified Micromonospora]|uniref:type I-G CRISPR-associated protein Csb2 n=1 Tax=unclassified Micromonospora TaxID=2617518 RepID=UPI003A874EEF